MRKKIGRARKTAACLLSLLTGWMILSPTSQALRILPDTYRLNVGEAYALNVGAAVLSSTDERLNLQNNVLTAREKTEAEVSINLFGLFPIGRLKVQADNEQRIMPGGAAVGVALATQGVLVIGVSDVSGKSPAQAAGLRAGDVIELVNGTPVNSSQHLVDLISSSKGMPLSLTFERNGSQRNVSLQPTLDSASGQYRMGAWVRDSTAGVGTLSYYNPQNDTYGALGHVINDGDTGKLLPVRLGSLLKAEIVEVKKGEKGTPGELRGSFLRDQVVLGSIEENTNLGVFGQLDAPYVNPLYPDGLPIGFQETVKTGPATILSTIDGEGVKEYSVEIVQVSRQMAPSQKSMIIRVTDPRLLETTGGIVQGMSGSPILQNGHIIGAVTHVFVDDPTHGYGLYIEWMLNAAEALDNAA
ncbi:MAG: SpoIVB peptidase [Clostridia bacterium]|nr:SpoIVB peptidase [Clostridia bacterium]